MSFYHSGKELECIGPTIDFIHQNDSRGLSISWRTRARFERLYGPGDFNSYCEIAVFLIFWRIYFRMRRRIVPGEGRFVFGIARLYQKNFRFDKEVGSA